MRFGGEFRSEYLHAVDNNRVKPSLLMIVAFVGLSAVARISEAERAAVVAREYIASETKGVGIVQQMRV